MGPGGAGICGYDPQPTPRMALMNAPFPPGVIVPLKICVINQSGGKPPTRCTDEAGRMRSGD